MHTYLCDFRLQLSRTGNKVDVQPASPYSAESPPRANHWYAMRQICQDVE